MIFFASKCSLPMRVLSHWKQEMLRSPHAHKKIKSRILIQHMKMFLPQQRMLLFKEKLFVLIPN